MAKNTVTVACKYPNGLALPAVAGMPEGFVPPVLKGAYTHPSFQPTQGMLHSIAFGSTEVDADYWEAFKQQFSGWAPLKKGLIFASAKKAELNAEVKDKEDVTAGLAGADPTAKGSGVEKAKLK